jgi:hypothetical protein
MNGRDELNQGVIAEFRTNHGQVGGQFAPSGLVLEPQGPAERDG